MFPDPGAAGGPLTAVYGHYMGLNLGLFWQKGEHMPFDFRGGQSDGFTGVFFTGRHHIVVLSRPTPLLRESRNSLRGAFAQARERFFRCTPPGSMQKKVPGPIDCKKDRRNPVFTWVGALVPEKKPGPASAHFKKTRLRSGTCGIFGGILRNS